ncbi:twin-arginine translocase subunit TatC [Deminuibacter soli]|uniref:Sec-independent protein translocase protein TatC n=1 Tax=Deminuibacter soli TaxID=2291815 RepID=A0A3E1NR90_9BACT|nr:twin-arginine translocase subunit TatC [Deminuibacter soli]RFM30452.1 twin-arginine translocase subunit TatC [Deminuibacter soli]
MAKSFFSRRNATAEMSFVDHLEALRWHILRSVIAILVMAVVIFINIEWIFTNIIAGPINPDFISYKALCDFSHWAHMGDAMCMPPVHITMQTTTFGGQFISGISIAFILGFIISFPYIFWEFWRFIKPALRPKELKNTRFIIFWVSFFFFLGAAFGYFLLGPFTFNFLGGFKIANLVETKPTINDYLDNLTNIILGCGLAFELPVLSFALTKIGLITPDVLKKSQKFAIVVILIVAAVITPSPDWMSQTIVFIPLFLLYQLSIIVSVRAYKDYMKADEERREEEPEEWS